MKPPAPPPITPEQLREARTALGWSQYFLAHTSRVTTSFIYGFEKTGRVAPLRRKPQGFDALAILRVTLEAAGIEFTNGDLPVVQLRRPETP